MLNTFKRSNARTSNAQMPNAEMANAQMHKWQMLKRSNAEMHEQIKGSR